MTLVFAGLGKPAPGGLRWAEGKARVGAAARRLRTDPGIDLNFAMDLVSNVEEFD